MSDATREQLLETALKRAAYVAQHLVEMIDQDTWRSTGGDDGQGHYEGDYRAARIVEEIKEWATLAKPEADATSTNPETRRGIGAGTGLAQAGAAGPGRDENQATSGEHPPSGSASAAGPPRCPRCDGDERTLHTFKGSCTAGTPNRERSST